MDRFYSLPLLNAYDKKGSKKSQAILMAFRSCILTGKPELLLYLMCFFFLVNDLTYNSIRFDISLETKRSEEYSVFSYAFGCNI